MRISYHFSKFPFPSEVCWCWGGTADGSSHHHVAEAAGIKLFTFAVLLRMQIREPNSGLLLQDNHKINTLTHHIFQQSPARRS